MDSLHAHLRVIYGDSAADEFAPRLAERIATTRERIAESARGGQLSERDAIVITYADQLRAPGEPPLATLADFFRVRIAPWIPHVHLLPFYPSSSDDGFSVMDYYAVDPEFGDWSDIRELGKSFGLMFDAVFNHASAQGVWFRKFLDNEPGWETAFFTVEGDPDLSAVVRPRTHPVLTSFETARGPERVWTTFSADQVDINFADPRMMLRLAEVLLFYLEQGARFIRLDAIAFLWKVPGTTCIHLDETHEAVRLFRAITDAVDPSIRIITETNVPHDLNISYFGNGTNEAHMVYNFALPPLVFHTFRSGDASRLTAWAGSLSLPSSESTFFNFLASHDGIGVNPARGILAQDEIDALVATTVEHGGFVSEKSNPDGSTSPYELNINFFDALNGGGELTAEAEEIAVDRFVAAHAILFCLRGVPGVYFHSLSGSRGDRAGAESSGIKRRINRQKFTRAQMDAALSNAASREARIFSRLQALWLLRSGLRAFAPDAPQEVLDISPHVFALRRGSSETGHALVLINVTDSARTIDCEAWSGELAPYAVQITPSSAV